MQAQKTFRKFLAFLLTLTLLGTLLAPAVSAQQSKQSGPISEQIEENRQTEDSVPKADQESHALTDIVRVSIQLEAPPAVDMGYSMDHVADNPDAVRYRESLRSQQKLAQSRIESALGQKLDVRMNLTLLMNVISANVRYGDLDRIRAVPGVKAVEIETLYAPPEPVEEEPAEPNTANTSTYMVGATEVWAEGYTGAGSRIAILDTGLDTTHQSFNADAFDYAIQQTGKTADLFTEADLDAVKSQLSAGNPIYVSSKVPFGYNYADNNTTIDHMSDTQGEHGSHVAGIAAQPLHQAGDQLCGRGLHGTGCGYGAGRPAFHHEGIWRIGRL